MTKFSINVTKEQYERYSNGESIHVEPPQKTYIVILKDAGKVFEAKGGLKDGGRVLYGKSWKRIRNFTSDTSNSQLPKNGGAYNWIASDNVTIVELND